MPRSCASSGPLPCRESRPYNPAPPGRSMKFRSIAVEGPIGVGKTSFVELLARKFDAQKVLEKVDNPFLQEFYQDKTGAAFQAQLFFLLSRYRQMFDLSQRDLFHQVVLCDYILPKD